MLGYKCVSNCSGYYHFAGNRSCLLSCSAGYFYTSNGTDSKYCSPCQSPCANCLSATKCLSCPNGLYFYNYTCKPSCPSGYYPSQSNNTCDNCISPCNTCTNKTSCLSCNIGYWNGINCTLVCDFGKYGNNSTRKC